MNSPFSLKKLIIAVTVLFMVQAASAQSADEKLQSTPHSVYAGIGPSFIPGVSVYKAEMLMGSIKNGFGFNAGYEYSFPKSHWTVGVNYTLHSAGGMVQYTPITTSLPIEATLPISFYVHNITPTVGGQWTWGKHGLKIAGGVGYMHTKSIIDLEQLENKWVEIKAIDEDDAGASIYLSLQYEYRFSSRTGLFIKLHDMEHYEKSDLEDKEWEGIVGYGISLGFNFHF